jgi:rhodanese-related sulfurtransferase
MNARNNLSAILLCTGIILAALPLSSHRSLDVRPSKVLSQVLGDDIYMTPDQVARSVVAEDKDIMLIDLRSPDEYMAFNIPGSVNYPYYQFLARDPEIILKNGRSKTIFYSNGDMYANYALVIARGLNFRNTYVMKGGLNKWFDTVMNSSFRGDRISPRENALFETRLRARSLFTQLNSLPDSLKQKFIESKHLAARKLDGGCE